MHELLPWYVAGTLATAEAAAFRSHLAGCRACKDDMEFLEALRSQLRRHGETFLAEHPAPDDLFSYARGELASDAARLVRRHLALCATCGAEIGWIRGKAVARAHEAPPTRVRSLPSWIPWAAAVAAGLVGFLVAPHWRPSAPREAGPLSATFLPAPQRAGEERPVILLQPGQQRFLLVVDADLDRGAFPARFEILDAAGRVVQEARVGAGVVYRGTFLFIDCDRSEFPDGTYVLRLSPAGAPLLDYPFEVQSAP